MTTIRDETGKGPSPRDARDMFDQGRLDEAAAAFSELAKTGDVEGWYGLGMVYLKAGNTPSAESSFERALALAPGHLNAGLQLGMLAERSGDRLKAISRYEAVLAAHPRQALAASRLVALSRSASDGAGRATHDPVSDGDPEGRRWSSVVLSRHGVYDALLRDGSETSWQTLKLIEALERGVSPRSSAFGGRLLVASLAAGLLMAVGLGLVRGVPAQPAFVLVGAGVLGFTYLWIRNTTYTLRRGRLQIASGILSRRISNLELWRVADMWLTSSLLNRLTNDGTLEFELHNNKRRMKVTGLATADELELVYQDLLNLVFLLRSQQAVKGIIY
jgi:tetratricopeptide (TPR) repeat protein